MRHWDATGSETTLWYRPPATTREYLDGEVAGLHRLRLALEREAEPSGAALGEALRWVAAHTYALDCPDPRVRWGALDEWARQEVLEAWLSPADVLEYAVAVLDSAGLDAHLLSEARRYLDVVADGGCECRACMPRAGHAPAERPNNCMIRDISPTALAAVVSWWPSRDDPSLDAPFWTYQLRQAWHGAQGARKQREAASQVRGDELAAELQSRGIPFDDKRRRRR